MGCRPFGLDIRYGCPAGPRALLGGCRCWGEPWRSGAGTRCTVTVSSLSTGGTSTIGGASILTTSAALTLAPARARGEVACSIAERESSSVISSKARCDASSSCIALAWSTFLAMRDSYPRPPRRGAGRRGRGAAGARDELSRALSAIMGRAGPASAIAVTRRALPAPESWKTCTKSISCTSSTYCRNF